MNPWQKIASASIAGAVWCAAIIGRHYWPDIDISGLVTACASILSSLGVYHIMQPKGN